MANSILHAIGTPIYFAKYTVIIPYFSSTGDPTDPTTPDTEISIDGGAFADCTNEVTTITGSNGAGYITLTGDEMTAQVIVLAAKVASGPKPTLAVIYPQVCAPGITSAGVSIVGTSPGGGSTTLCYLAADPGFNPIGCWIISTGGTGGGGGNGCLNNQARLIAQWNAGTLALQVYPALETAWDNTTTYALFLPPGQLTTVVFPTSGGRVG